MLALSLAVAAAAENEPHYHDGKLTRYEIGPPSVLLSRSDEERLSSGKPVMQAMETGIVGARRLLMVQDIAAPPNVVMDRIMDLAHYDKMVDGVTRNVEYNREQEGGLQRIKTTYDIAVLHMKMRYFMEHEYDPEKRCMTFHLDYSRRSDIDDSVGYWYVEPGAGRASSRVYYSCECKLRGWVPSPVYNVLTKEALSKATTWVAKESVKEWRNQQQNDGLLQFVTGVRDAMEQLKLPPLPQPPHFVSRFVGERRAAAVRFVSNRRIGRKLAAAPSAPL
mmetsp:Transcript_8920/g.29587  ORF Transcript_8920/g.29587 Transcript_8920/m.29587 type:complete len:278 (+) Transcript_8920:43-876(+)